MVRVRRSILYLFFMTLIFPVLVSAVVPSYLDTSFNRPYGYVTLEARGMTGERPNGIAIQNDGKIVVVDTTGENSNEPQIAVIRYLPDGRLDQSFNGQGWVLYNNNYLSFAADVAIQKDGNIVVAGFRSQSGQNGYNVILLRFNSFGETDTTFGNGGEIDIPNNVSFDGVNTVASLTIQGDGKILLATHAGAPGSDSKKLLLLRFEKNGIPDESFGSEGRVEYTEYIYGNPAAGGFSSDNIMGRKVKIAPDGTINVLVKVFAYTIVLKYDIQGVLLWESMPFCGPTGCAIENSVGGLPRGMEVQPDGKIVIVGEAGTLPFVLRYTPDGNLDSAFGNGSGVVYFNYKDHFGYSDDPVRSSNARNVAIQPDGSILMVGSCPMNHDGDSLSDDMDVFVARYLSNGTADASFGVNGVVSFDGGWRGGITYFGDSGQSVAVQPDGKIVVVGSIRVYDNPGDPDSSYSHNDMVVIRFGDQSNPETQDIEVSPVHYDYGEVQQGRTKTKQFTLSNIGQSELSVSNIELTSGDRVNFAIDPGTCQNLTPTILPGNSCMINVQFVPGSEGIKTATLGITSGDPYVRTVTYGPVEVSLQGTGIAAQLRYTLDVSTDGNGVGIVQSKPKGIKCGKNWPDCNKSYAAGTEITLFSVVEQEESRFMGWSGACAGKKECKFVMDSDKEVKATFMADPTIVVWPKYRDLRSLKIGRMKAAFFVIKNSTKNGRKPLLVEPIEPLTAPFQIFKDECSGNALEPREVCVFGVLFEPESVGTFTANISISSNDPATPVTAVQLKGSGVAPPPPKPPRKK